jgi:hypothetical protein
VTTLIPHAATTRHRSPRWVDEGGIRFGIAEACLVGTALVAGAARLPSPVAFVLLTLVAVVGAWHLGPVSAAALGVSAWAFWTGFLDHRMGQLTTGGLDLDRLLLVVVLALGTAVLHRVFHHVRSGVVRHG